MPRPRRYDEELRRLLLEVSSEAISRYGPQGASLRAIAAAAGTTTAAIYALFGSREQLIEAVVAEGFTRFAARLAATARTADPAADLLALGAAYRASALADPNFYQVMFSGVVDLSQLLPDRGTFTVLLDAVRRLTHGPLESAEQQAYQLWALVHGLVDLELTANLPGDERQRAARYEQTLRTLGPALVGRTPPAG